MQNKANPLNHKTNTTSYATGIYPNIPLQAMRKNKPNQSQFLARGSYMEHRESSIKHPVNSYNTIISAVSACSAVRNTEHCLPSANPVQSVFHQAKLQKATYDRKHRTTSQIAKTRHSRGLHRGRARPKAHPRRQRGPPTAYQARPGPHQPRYPPRPHRRIA